jgi:nucleotide-binding universal stress UspA family protein
MKALIAVDGSAGSFEAVRQTSQLLQGPQDRAVLYYAPPGIQLDRGTASPQILDRARSSLANAVFDEAKQLLSENLRATCEAILGTGSPKQSIPAAAKNCGAELIALGARGVSTIQRLLLGSVSSSVAHSAPVPVLVVRPRASGREGQPPRVLVACSSAAEDANVAQFINRIFWPVGTHGETIAVVQSMFAGHVPKWLEEQARSEEVEAMARAWVEDHQAELASKQAEMAAFNAQLPEPFRTPPIVVEGHPAEGILGAANQHASDLIAIGSHTDSSVARFFLGSTSRAILAHAHTSVLIVRPAA